MLPQLIEVQTESTIYIALTGLGFCTELNCCTIASERWENGLSNVSSCCKCVDNIKDICLKCLQMLIDRHLPICDRIQAGDVHSRRHDDFHNGIKTRNGLNRQCYSVRVFSDEQHDLALETLKRRFCPNRSLKKLRYILSVLIEEVLIRIFAEFLSIDFIEAEKKMRPPLVDHKELRKAAEKLQQMSP